MQELHLEEAKALGTPRQIALKGKEQYTRGTVYVQHFTEGARLWRGAKVGISMLVVTALSLLIPILHFFLPPIFLVITIVATAITFGPKSMILGGIGICPFCQKEFRIFRRADRYPFTDVCEACGRQVMIEAGS